MDALTFSLNWSTKYKTHGCKASHYPAEPITLLHEKWAKKPSRIFILEGFFCACEK
jgi:hypothetical protein